MSRMKQIISLAQAGALACGLLAESARPSSGVTVALFPDAINMNCSIFDSGPGLLPIYVVVVLCAGYSASALLITKGSPHENDHALV